MRQSLAGRILLQLNQTSKTMKNQNRMTAPQRTRRLGSGARWKSDQLDYALFCANLWHFYPQASPNEYPRLYGEVLDMQRQAYLRQPIKGLGNMDTDSLNETLARIKKSPGIICTYHTGAYRQICWLLAQAGIPYTLLLSAAAIKRQETELRREYAQMAAPYGPDGFNLLDAERPSVIREMCRALARGHNIVAYVDGNTGAADKNSRNLMEIPFLNGRLQVRKGIASLSHLSRKPIYPILNSRAQNGSSVFSTSAPLWPTLNESRADYEVRVTSRLYALLAGYVNIRPSDWECWRYLHHWLPQHAKLSRSGQLAYQRYGALERWHRVVRQGRPFLLDRFTYRLYRVAETNDTGLRSESSPN